MIYQYLDDDSIHGDDNQITLNIIGQLGTYTCKSCKKQSLNSNCISEYVKQNNDITIPELCKS